MTILLCESLYKITKWGKVQENRQFFCLNSQMADAQWVGIETAKLYRNSGELDWNHRVLPQSIHQCWKLWAEETAGLTGYGIFNDY